MMGGGHRLSWTSASPEKLLSLWKPCWNDFWKTPCHSPRQIRIPKNLEDAVKQLPKYSFSCLLYEISIPNNNNRNNTGDNTRYYIISVLPVQPTQALGTRIIHYWTLHITYMTMVQEWLILISFTVS